MSQANMIDWDENCESGTIICRLHERLPKMRGYLRAVTMDEQLSKDGDYG